ncbi:MAG: ATP-binding protein [bacterium]|nr:ATP-binding protein [bacterium]
MKIFTPLRGLLAPLSLCLFSAIVFVVIYLTSADWIVKEIFLKPLSSSKLAESTVYCRVLKTQLVARDWTELDEYFKDIVPASETRVTIALPSGQAIADSAEVIKEIEPITSPVPLPALAQTISIETVTLPGINRPFFSIFIPAVQSDIGPLNFLYILPTERAEIFNIQVQALFLVASLLTMVLIFVYHFIAQKQLRNLARRISQWIVKVNDSDLSVPQAPDLHLPFSDIIPLINQLAESRVFCLTNTDKVENRHQEAVIRSIAEGVIAVDTTGRIHTINPAASALLEVNINDVVGKLIEETIRNFELQQFIKDTLDKQQTLQREIASRGTTNKTLLITGSVLIDGFGQKIGAVVLLSDVTRIKKLENMRSEFASNVSHELKTPIASIKGFVETILDMDFAEEPQKARRFLEIIERSAARLHYIVDDLLTLSRIEHSGSIEKRPCPILPLLRSAASACTARHSQRNVSLKINCDENIVAPCNSSLLEQAIVNLIDNAIKYSDKNSEIAVQAWQGADQKQTPVVNISVKDTGCGISTEHLDRLFERFYVVDKARSREKGGTGLGLSIVKHITLAHKGSIKVNSSPGVGSEFIITIPAA